MTTSTGGPATATGVDGIPEVVAGDDLAALVHRHAPTLETGDVVVVTSKVVSKSEGRVVHASRQAMIDAETQRVVARRGPTSIVRTRHGLTLAAAGVDASNTEAGTVVLLPDDADRSARRIRDRLGELTGRNVAVLVSDTAGRAWRHGQTDLAIGCAGLAPLDDHAGRHDSHGNELAVTAPAVADEVAGMAELVTGKLAGRPVAVVRGLAHLVLPAGHHGPGARALVRDDATDMFVLGAREAVLAAVDRDDDPDAWAALAAASAPEHGPHSPGQRGEQLVARAGRSAGAPLEVRAVGEQEVEVVGRYDVPTAVTLERVCVLAAVHGWRVVADDRNLGRCRIVLRWAGRTP